MKHKLLIFAALILLAGLAACDKGGQEEGTLQRALGMLPADAPEVLFTDWDLIKEYEGATGISSQSSLEERRQFLLFGMRADLEEPQPMRQAVASGFGLNRVMVHAETWGWDSTDLVWEVTLFGMGAPMYVLQFPDDFDFDPLVARFDERGFSQSTYRDVTIYSSEMDLSADWLRATEFAIVNTAMLAEEKQLVLSADVGGVQSVLDVIVGGARSLADVPGASATVDRLGEVAAAHISSSPDTCQSSGDVSLEALLNANASEELMEELKEQFAVAESVHPYTALGVGYRYEGDRALGLLVIHYPDADDAQADLEPRRQLAQEGFSFRTRRPYSEILFTVDEATAQDGDLVLQVSPIENVPRRLFTMMMSRDLLFAVCP